MIRMGRPYSTRLTPSDHEVVMDQVRESNPIQVIKSGIPDSMSEHTRIRVFEINFRRLGISYGTSPQSVSPKLYDTVIQSTVPRTLHRTPPGNRYFAGYESLSTSGTWKQRSTTRQVRGITVVTFTVKEYPRKLFTRSSETHRRRSRRCDFSTRPSSSSTIRLNKRGEWRSEDLPIVEIDVSFLSHSRTPPWGHILKKRGGVLNMG